MKPGVLVRFDDKGFGFVDARLFSYSIGHENFSMDNWTGMITRDTVCMVIAIVKISEDKWSRIMPDKSCAFVVTQDSRCGWIHEDWLKEL